MNTIALAFSGGGYRAACFSLGTLSYLDHIQYEGKPLLNNVKSISSTSGGSITNLIYASFLYQGKDFAACYAYLNTELDGEKIISKALHILRSSKEWKLRPDKTRNLINAFSIAYDELLNKKTFGMFNTPVGDPHLEEICVNATEFTNGQAFRFQSQRPGITNGKVGNGYIYFTTEGMKEAAQLKLADILASSSCFPSGFEPLIFPGDYTYDQLSSKQLREAISYKANAFTIPGKEDNSDEEAAINREAGFAESLEEDHYNTYDLLKDDDFNKDINFGIMDGGVTDNQAIEGMKMSDNRRRKNNKTPYDLFMACDVSSYFMDGYTLPLEKKKWYSRLTINNVLLLWILGSLVLPAMLLLVKCWCWWMYIPATLSGLMLLPVIIILGKRLLAKKKPATSWSTMIKKYKPIFFGLRLGALQQMILSRAKSVFILANDIYLKQIRRMYYEALFGNPDTRNRTIQNAIYDLSKAKFPASRPKQPLQPSPAMIDIAEKARTMGTTLWFDEQHIKEQMKQSIIATGQFTTCYNLLKYLNKKKPEELTPQLVQLKQDLEKDWNKFLENPMCMVQ